VSYVTRGLPRSHIKELKKKFKIAGEVEEGCLFKYQKDIKPYVSSHHLTSARILYYEGQLIGDYCDGQNPPTWRGNQNRTKKTSKRLTSNNEYNTSYSFKVEKVCSGEIVRIQ
jgi:hypothetical protein